MLPARPEAAIPAGRPVPHLPPLSSPPHIQLLLLERLVLCDNWMAPHMWLLGGSQSSFHSLS